jgi:hypothetical protein
MDPRYYSVLNDDLRTKLEQSNSSIEDSSETIIELDGKKAPYDDIIISLDNDILTEVNSVNTKIIDVSNAYQDRINVGCRTDVFWRRVGLAGTVHTLVATKLSLAGYAGTLTDVEYFDGVGFVTYDNYDTFGYTTENAYGIKYYDEPVTQDIGNTFVTSFIGTISPGENKLTVLSVVGSSSTTGIATGQLVISSKDGVIPSSSNIIGIGTTALSRSVLGISTGSIVSILTLDATATGIASAPESNGSFVTFTVLTSITEFGFDDYEIQSDKDPYSPQTIGIMTSGNIAIGVSVKYDNSGNEPNVISWDPDLFDDEDPSTFEPEVGAGVYYLPVGFTSYPVSLSGQRVAVGFATTVTDAQLPTILTLATSCPTEETNLTNAINTLNTAKSDISSGISTLNYKIDVANTFREQRKEIQSEIWGLSQQIASYRADIITYNKALNYLGVSTVTDTVL